MPVLLKHNILFIFICVFIQFFFLIILHLYHDLVQRNYRSKAILENTTLTTELLIPHKREKKGAYKPEMGRPER